MLKVAFIDRDGTLLYEPPDTKHIDAGNFQPLPDIEITLKSLQEQGYVLIVVSNQESGPTEEIRIRDFHVTQAMLNKYLDQFSVVFDEVFLCPHRKEDNCGCRKPLPGMVDAFLREHTIDTSQSFMIGDRGTDGMFAKNIGVRFVPMKSNDRFPSTEALLSEL